ncbi:MAG: hypothetical protein ACOX8R_01660 [Bacillota bacterium]|jgi:hypothetical protein
MYTYWKRFAKKQRGDGRTYFLTLKQLLTQYKKWHIFFNKIAFFSKKTLDYHREDKYNKRNENSEKIVSEKNIVVKRKAV